MSTSHSAALGASTLNPPLAAFMCYLRFADNYDGHRLTRFWERLTGELQLWAGQAIPTFQDRREIQAGRAWRSEINSALDNAAFLVAILTPGLFTSEECRRELARFQRREKALGRIDRIIPVLYCDCRVLEDPDRRKLDPLAKLLASREMLDGRALRSVPLTAKPARTLIRTIAIRILDGLAEDLKAPAPPLRLPSAPGAGYRVQQRLHVPKVWQPPRKW